MTRTDKIRKYLLSLKPSERSPTAVAKALEKKGIKVTVHHVGMVKLALRGKRVLKRVGNRSGRSGRIKLKNSGLIIARDLLKSCNNDLDLALENIKIVSRLIG